MIITVGNVSDAYRIVDSRGIPLDNKDFATLQAILQPDEVLVALYTMGAFFEAMEIKSAPAQKAYRRRKDFRHRGYFAVKKCYLAGVKDLF